MNNKIKNRPKVVIALSGGVDSSVAAYLLKKQNYEVIAVFMQNWDDYLNNQSDITCGYLQEWKDASKVAEQLDIPIHKTYFISEYWNKVFLNFIKELKLGKTPNPDILCNKIIKFKYFIKYVFEMFSPDFIATGHYAGIEQREDLFYLKKAKDKKKDQTYFLCQINKKVLSKIIFPLSNKTKEEVRNIAKDISLINAKKKESMGICFVDTKEKKFNQFLSNYIQNNIGPIQEFETKKQIGTHHGLHFFTIGQRKGLSLTIKSNELKPYFVIGKERSNNILYVTNNAESKYLYTKKCTVNHFNWLISTKEINGIIDSNNLTAKLRSQQDETPIKITTINIEKKEIYISFKENQRAVTSGQYAVLYNNFLCLGGGIIQTTDKINEFEELY